MTPDPVAHERASLESWIHSAPEEVIRSLFRVRRNLDANLRRPPIPDGWSPLRRVATERDFDPGHLARLCRDVYAAQGLARICLHRNRQTWCIAPDAIAQLPTHRATNAPCGGGLTSASASDGVVLSRAAESPREDDNVSTFESH